MRNTRLLAGIVAGASLIGATVALLPTPVAASPHCPPESTAPVCGGEPKPPPPLGRALNATYTWAMESRFDATGNTEVNPSHWIVHFNGCKSTAPNNDIRTYWWSFEGKTQATRSCRSGPMKFSRLGWQSVTLTIMTDATQKSSNQQILLRDLLVVSMGDSVAAGEGAPKEKFNLKHDAAWTDRRCHRSKNGVQVLAAKELERRDPHTSVTFRHVACSGASIYEGADGDGGIVRPYRGIDRRTKDKPAFLRSQVDVVQDAVGKRRIDLLLLSAGANDLGFGAIIEDCLNTANCAKKGNKMRTRTEDRLAKELPKRYALLAQVITARFAPRSVIVGEYPDPTHKANGTICNPLLNAPSLERVKGTITVTEARWAYDGVVKPLNRLIRATANTYRADGWSAVTGIEGDFRTHGYCAGAKATWFRQLTSSLLMQRNKVGAVQPKTFGYANMLPRYMQAIDR